MEFKLFNEEEISYVWKNCMYKEVLKVTLKDDF